MRKHWLVLMALALTGVSTSAMAEDEVFTTGDGTQFALPIVNGLPGRAENEIATFESAGFDTETSDAPALTDRFAFVFKSNERPLRVRVEDVTLATPILIAEASVPDDLPGAGFRRVRFEMRAAPCAIAVGEPCSEWMFGSQSHRLYRATLVYDGGDTTTLLQAEPFQMASFIARLGVKVPETSTDVPAQTAQSEQP